MLSWNVNTTNLNCHQVGIPKRNKYICICVLLQSKIYKYKKIERDRQDHVNTLT